MRRSISPPVRVAVSVERVGTVGASEPKACVHAPSRSEAAVPTVVSTAVARSSGAMAVRQNVPISISGISSAHRTAI
ncbi:hypothetical protein [Microbacterium sp. SORGH_AS_0421]|uniref:hypothetical protein n=1 Tax=Microbacterium sp. SORGH_AS_0421 TaxID=3041768 RepID=UPI002793C44D|nr:hypothetical protein [Microbacterium sp. SORGH_AS_0421]MDQ1176048.1 hypothetical protein [Microbacterium sp. SORGH_AS_0421]